MKRISIIFILVISFILNFQAQTLDEANRLFAGKKYIEAATMYYQLYQFNKAVDSYNLQIDEFMKGKKPQTESANALKPLLAQAEKAARMLSRCENIQIIDSIIVNKNDFLSTYVIGEETGTLEQTYNTVIYENQLKDHRYFAKKDENGFYRLKSQLKFQDVWTEEKMLNLPSDTKTDDNFPFVMPDGLTIYYASNGNGSIGGYDLFISRYNLNNDTYFAPNQMGMPFNSIYNDYMLVIDEVNEIGYFASDRFQPDNKVVVYTFIPNDRITPIESNDEQELRNRAKITSIRDSWLPNVNYLSKLDKIKTDIEKERNKVTKDFTFVINDNIVYYTLADFESDAAKNLFLQSKNMEESISNLEEQLENQRKEFAQAGNAKKQTLKSSIITNEQNLETMYQAYKKLLVETRNSEIKYLRTKN